LEDVRGKPKVPKSRNVLETTGSRKRQDSAKNHDVVKRKAVIGGGWWRVGRFRKSGRGKLAGDMFIEKRDKNAKVGGNNAQRVPTRTPDKSAWKGET